jgi:hypothetical protein
MPTIVGGSCGRLKARALGAVDTIYAARGRIARIYLLDAVAEATLVATWLATGSGRGRR